MFRRIHWSQYFIFALPAAILYCVPVFIFIRQSVFSQSWLLYLGNFLFMIMVIAFLINFNRKRDQNASSITMLLAGHITTIMGMIMALVFALILLAILVPGELSAGQAGQVLSQTPANATDDKTNGLNFQVIMDALLGNFAIGSFVSIIFPFTIKREQRSESVPRRQAEL